MAEKEMQAHDMVRRRSWSRAVTLYDQLLSSNANAGDNNSSSGGSSARSSPSSANGSAAGSSSITITNTNNASSGGGSGAATRLQKDRLIACLLGRCECLLELGKYEACLTDARRVLALLADQTPECLASVSRARRWLVHALCKLKKYTEADQTLREWITELNGQPSCAADILKTLERYKSIILIVNNGNNNNTNNTNSSSGGSNASISARATTSTTTASTSATETAASTTLAASSASSSSSSSSASSSSSTGNNKTSSKAAISRLEDEMATLDTKLDHWATNNLPLDKYSKLLSNKGLKKRDINNGSSGNSSSQQQQQQTNGSLSSNSSTSSNGVGSGNSSSSNVAVIACTSSTTALSSASSTASSSALSSSSASSSSSSSSSSSTAATLQKTTDLLAAIDLAGDKHQIKKDDVEGNGDGIETSVQDDVGDDLESGTGTCSYCAITFKTRIELREHCQTESHQNVIMSDEGRDWKWRPPPRGFTLDYYGLCESYSETQTCHYGAQCVEAHGIEELNEWKDRFEYRRMRLQKACEKELFGKSYTEQILERWIQATAPDRIMCERVDGVEAHCEQELVTSISSKSSKREWIFELKSTATLKAVALLQDAHRNHFAIKAIKVSNTAAETTATSTQLQSIELKSSQEWVSMSPPPPQQAPPPAPPSSPPSTKTTAAATKTEAEAADDLEIKDTTTSAEEEKSADKEKEHKDVTTTKTPTESDVEAPAATPLTLEHQVIIEFHTDIYGTFRQAICFDFGTEPMLMRHLCVDVVPVSDIEKIEEIKRDIINSSATRWDISNTQLAKFETTIGTHLRTEAYMNDLKHEKEMLERYPCPRAQTFTLTQSTILEKRLTQNNYRSRIHELLYVEEIARYEQIARFNVRTKLTVASTYILTPAGMATSTAKYSLQNELFALMRLGKDISEDTSPGRLILSNCSSVYISPPEEGGSPIRDKDNKKRKVYEALIEDKGKNVIYLKLSAKCVEEMALKADTEIDVDIQFQLNRLPYCEWHNAVDKITDFKIIFPDTDIEPNIPWTPKKQWSDTCEPKLNAKQREAVNAITTSLGIKLPPILLIGPFGTGKTYTLAQAIKQLLTQPDAKILICTHSNSAADLYIKEYLHPWIEDGVEEATPLRVYYHKRWVATVNHTVQKYCITDELGNFRRPTVEDIFKHRIVVVTLSISMELATLGLPKGYFTHIFLDEAAQAMECEAIMPLALANDTTRIVLAGDHMQMSPELFSAFAKERKLHISLLERLYDHYPSMFPCKILLCENYRAHEAIIKFTSELFYEQKLIASGKQPRHDRFYPLTFFTTRGEDVQDKNSTAFYNNSEVYELVERVSELRKKWPSSWGKMNDASIGIMTPYSDQVFRIRSELRKRRMGGISVERVLNVQGKQFRAVFLSTVRTRRTCMPQQMHMPGHGGGPVASPAASSGEDADYGFLSNSKLLNTAITRAQSLVAVVGDPVALCSIGRCRKVWERFIEICDENNSLFGITWSFLRSQLDGVELKRGYVLNPLAPEFVPRSLQPEAYVRDQAAMFLMGGQPAAAAAAASAANSGHHGGHGGHGGMPHGTPTHHGGGGSGGNGSGGGLPPHLNVPGMPHLPPAHHAALSAANQPMPPHMYPPHPAAAAAYSAAAAAAAMINQAGKGPGPGPGPVHHFPGPTGSQHQMQNMRPPMGPPHQPQQGPQPATLAALSQQFNTRGPPPPPAGVHPGTAPGAHFPQQYMAWQQAQQQQQQLRGNGPPNQQGPPGGPGGLPNSQNPNASLWGPPPQSNPWSALPKQQMPPSQQPPNANSGRPMPPPPQQQQQPQPNAGMRGGSVPLQPPLPSNQPQPPQMRANPSDLGFLAKKSLFGGQQQHPSQPPPSNTQAPGPPPLGNFPVGFTGAGNQMQPPLQPLLNQQRNVVMPNGPISDPFMQQRPPQAPPTNLPTSGGPPNNFYGSADRGGRDVVGSMGASGGTAAVGLGGFKDKDFQFLNNVHIPLNMFQGPPPPMMNNNSNKQQSPTALRFPTQQQQQQQQLPPDYAALLPPNVNIYEMAFESNESQYKWYLKLMEMQGQEAATKFMEVLRQVTNVLQQQHANQLANKQIQQQQQQQQASTMPLTMQQQLSHVGNLPRELLQQSLMQQQQQQPPMLGGGGGGSGNNQMNNPLNQHHQQQQQHRNSHNPYMNSVMGAGTSGGNPMAMLTQGGGGGGPGGISGLQPDTPPLDGSINFNQQVDLAFNSLMNGNEIAQPILRDLFGVGIGNGIAGGLNLGGGGSMTSGQSAANEASLLATLNGSTDLLTSAGNKPFTLLGAAAAVAAGNNSNNAAAAASLASSLQKSMYAGMQQQHASSAAQSLQQSQQQQQQQSHMGPPQQQQQQQAQQPQHHLQGPLGGGGQGQQQQQNAGNFLNNPLLNNKDLMLGGNAMAAAAAAAAAAANSAASVPLYRRQATPMNGGSGGGGGFGGGGGMGGVGNLANGGMGLSGVNLGQLHHPSVQQQQQQQFQQHQQSSSSGSAAGGGANDNLLSNDILPGLNTSGGNLIEALFHTNHHHQHQQHQQQQQQQQHQHDATPQSSNSNVNKNFPKMLYNNFNTPELFGRGGSSDVHHDGGQQQHHHHQQQSQSQQQQHHQSSGGNVSVGASASNTHVTYAAVLSQGPLGGGGGGGVGGHKQQNVSNAVSAHHGGSNSGGSAGTHGVGIGGSGGNSGGAHVTAEKDPFAAIRELGQATNGFYNYFQ